MKKQFLTDYWQLQKMINDYYIKDKEPGYLIRTIWNRYKSIYERYSEQISLY